MSQKRARSVSATTRPEVLAFAVAPVGDPHLTNGDVRTGRGSWRWTVQLKHINDTIGGSILLQEGSMQTIAGAGPLNMHIHVQKVPDGAGHQSAHFSNFGSWMGSPQDAVSVSPPVAVPPTPLPAVQVITPSPPQGPPCSAGDQNQCGIAGDIRARQDCGVLASRDDVSLLTG